MDQQTLMVVILGAVCFAALAFVLLAPTQKDKAKSRIASLDTAGAAKSAATAASEGNAKERRRKLNQALEKIDSQKEENKKKKKLTLQQSIDQSGLSISIKQFYIGSIFSAIALGFLGIISGQTPLISMLLFGVGGLGLPRWFINFARGKRQKKFADEFSNSIDVIVRGVKSGLPVNECMKIIASEAPKPINEEFHLLNEGIRVGLSLEQSLARMYERMPLQEVNFFMIVLIIQQKTGGNLGEALGNLSTVLRQRKLMVGKVKALSAEAKASAMIIGSLPFLVMGAVQLSSPDYLNPLFTTNNGKFVLMGAGLWMGTGIFVMKKMMQIKV